MKLKLKEDPKEWRKAALLSALGLAMLSSLLRWRRVLPNAGWLAVLAVLALVAAAACLRPRLFRGHYRFTHKLGFHASQYVGYFLLGLFFLVVLTPMGLVLRALGKDPLRLKRPAKDKTCWTEAKESGPLDRLF